MAEGKLREVEEDAIYIQSKRFADQREELAYAAAKQKREATKTNVPVETTVEAEDSNKKGK
jgi:hypothetical protein